MEQGSYRSAKNGKVGHNQTDEEKGDVDSVSSVGAQLPLELVARIIFELQQERMYKTMAELARTNSTFYDLNIPSLYETIIVSKTNQSLLRYGHFAGRSDTGTVQVASTVIRVAEAKDFVDTCPARWGDRCYCNPHSHDTLSEDDITPRWIEHV
jgi:hypothetical protein